MDVAKYHLLRNLVLVGLEQHGWLKQNVLTNNSEVFLDYILPKTKVKAAFNLATNIACLDHDGNILGNKIHLFRLPQNIEISMNRLVGEQKIADPLAGLSELAADIAVETAPGAINIGSTNELQSSDIICAFAKHYLEAFKGGYKTYPYLR